MSAYATARSGRTISPLSIASPLGTRDKLPTLDAVIEDIVERVAAAVVSRLTADQDHDEREWLDSRDAAEYLGVHRDTLRKLAAERAIPSHQDGRGCKLFFKRSDLDDWRRAGGRNAHLASALADAA
jgi:excisionase family DNA binding protein